MCCVVWRCLLTVAVCCVLHLPVRCSLLLLFMFVACYVYVECCSLCCNALFVDCGCWLVFVVVVCWLLFVVCRVLFFGGVCVVVGR